MSQEYLGTSLSNPVALSAGAAVIRSGSDVLVESIKDILNTVPGERLFLPEYGSRIHELLFEMNDDVLKDMMRLFVKEAMDKWERRVEFVKLEYEFDNATVHCTLTYRIKQANEIDSFVFPFYRKIKT